MGKEEILKELQFDAKSVLAGIMIGLGSIIYCMCMGISTVLGSFLFSLGLLSVIVQQHYLYTGKIGYVSQKKDILYMPKILLGNILGVSIICLLVSYTRIYPGILENADRIMKVKCEDSLISLFILGIGCGIMMYLAVDNYRKAKHPIFVILPIMFFITCCFEHCIADYGYFFLSSHKLTWDDVLRFLVIVAGNSVGSIILYRGNSILKS